MDNREYQEILENLLQRIDLLEKQLKKSKKADKDYDGDGEIESGTEEYFGSKDKAIKKAIAKKKNKKIQEALDRVGGNYTSNSPGVRCLMSTVNKNSPLVENVANILGNKKQNVSGMIKDKGTKIQLSESLIFGGFPTINEAQYNIPAKVSDFKDDDPSQVGMDEFKKILSGGGHPIMAGQDINGKRGVPPEIRKAAIKHIETLEKHPQGAVEGYSKEHPIFKQGMEAHQFFKKHFPQFGVEDEIASNYNLFDI